jgi:ethanolamine utilization protein EutA
VTDTEEGGRVVFARSQRNLADTEETTLTSVGVDIGSATTHLVFSSVVMEQRDGRYEVADRAVLFDSDILLTPYSDEDTIDADALGEFIAEQYRAASLTPDDIDTGALILTGVAVRRQNARAIGELFAVETGKFVSVSAGDHLETAMTAYGSGATLNSELTGATVMNIDIGGGTTKIAICAAGKIVDLTAIDIGARLIALDSEGQISRIEEAGKRFAAEICLDLEPGMPLVEEHREEMANHMADRLMEIISFDAISPGTDALLRLPPITWRGRIDVVTFSGGVSEFIYGNADRNFGDLGQALARAIHRRVEQAGFRIMEPVEGIRATVVGASQYTIQLSGTTIFVTSEDILPLRNIPVIAPDFALEDEELDIDGVAVAIGDALRRFDLTEGEKPVAVCFDWRGSASYRRTHDFLQGVTQGLSQLLAAGHPLVLVCEGDIGKIFGIHAAEELKIAAPIVSIDGIALEAFDFIDIGAMLPGSGAVPVVIKSLLFPGTGERERG